MGGRTVRAASDWPQLTAARPWVKTRKLMPLELSVSSSGLGFA